jgi:hypothetical protein
VNRSLKTVLFSIFDVYVGVDRCKNICGDIVGFIWYRFLRHLGIFVQVFGHHCLLMHHVMQHDDTIS